MFFLCQVLIWANVTLKITVVKNAFVFKLNKLCRKLFEIKQLLKQFQKKTIN